MRLHKPQPALLNHVLQAQVAAVGKQLPFVPREVDEEWPRVRDQLRFDACPGERVYGGHQTQPAFLAFNSRCSRTVTKPRGSVRSIAAGRSSRSSSVT